MFGSKIKLDKVLLDRCKEYSKEKGYGDVEEFISHVLEKELKNFSDKDRDDDAKLKNRLRGLGYID